jgi:predicted nucleotidyltransferase
MIPDENTLSRVVIEWAIANSNVKSVWLYGSRIAGSKKTASEDSDWDVAIEIDGTPEFIRAWWFSNYETIHAEIERKIGWQRSHREAWKGVHVEIFNPPETPTVAAAISEYAVLIYRRK